MPPARRGIESSRFTQKAILGALYEYLLITLPIALYAGLEALHEHNFVKFIVTPEWAIATIFLVFQAGALRRARFARARLRPGRAVAGLYSLVALVIVFVAAINAYGDLSHTSRWSVATRLGLFGLVSIGFVLVVSSAEFASLQRRTHK